MSNSVEGSVNVALALQDQSMLQQKNNLLLRKALDNQANMVTDLIQSATTPPVQPPLASSGMVGTQLHATA